MALDLFLDFCARFTSYFRGGLGGVADRVPTLQPLRPPPGISGQALHVGKLVVTCRCPWRVYTVQYALVSSACKTTHRNMILAVERDVKNNNK